MDVHLEEVKNFKNRVKDKIIDGAKYYQSYFVECDYLLCSQEFKKNKYYIIKGHEENFKHLTGVILKSQSTAEFFQKSLNGTLKEDDFEIAKDESDTQTKGNIRRKTAVLEGAMQIFSQKTYVEEDFNKNNIQCSFATENGSSTIGFTPTGKVVRPKTLLKGNQLDMSKAIEVDLVLKRNRGDRFFNKIIVGNKETLQQNKATLSKLVDEELFK